MAITKKQRDSVTAFLADLTEKEWLKYEEIGLITSDGEPTRLFWRHFAGVDRPDEVYPNVLAFSEP